MEGTGTGGGEADKRQKSRDLACTAEVTRQTGLDTVPLSLFLSPFRLPLTPNFPTAQGAVLRRDDIGESRRRGKKGRGFRGGGHCCCTAAAICV